MNQKFINSIKMWANMSTQGTALTSLGVVNAFDPNTYQVQVLLHAATDSAPALQTGWIPLATPWSGNGWGMFCPAKTGDLILVHFQDGSLQNPIAGMRLYFDGAQALNVPSGEFWLVHETGSYLKLTNDGKISISSGDNIEIISGTQINIMAPKINIVGSEVNIYSDAIKAGQESGQFQPLFKSDGSLTENVEAT